MMKYILSVLLIISSCYFGFSQVGINTTDPDASAALDIVADDSGILIPRMTTLQKTQIVDPAHSLLVYDTDLEGYYFNQGTTEIPNWTPMLSKKDERNNYVLVKSVDDLPEASGVGGTITLDPNTFYEINGRINLTASINLNNAYVSGKDASEDVLSFPGGTVFAGDTGGNIRNVTIVGAKSFEINAGGDPSSMLLVQNTIVSGNTTSVGQISGLGLFFGNIVQFVGNQNGITYSNIGNLLLNNQAWVGNNAGTYETFTGTFGLIQKFSGFSSIPSGATGLDVSNNPTVGTGTLFGTVFSGSGTYVEPYTSGSGIYTGFNFSDDWTINSPGIKQESDDLATGTIYIERNSTDNNPTFNVNGGTAVGGTTDSSNLFRMSDNVSVLSDNVLQYNGNKTRTFSVTGSLSYLATNGSNSTVHAFYLRRFDSNGTLIEIPLGTEVYEEVNNFNVRTVPIAGTIVLDPGDYVRVFGQRITGDRSIIKAYSLTLSLN